MSIERPSVYSALVDLNCTPKKDRLRIAQERREEKERIQAAREQALLAKEQRAQKQLERSAEERGRRLEQQRQREVLRRAAVDEKRRQQEELEKLLLVFAGVAGWATSWICWCDHLRKLVMLV
ncbi:hypothetical protein AALO_G00208380 [Alosa alosa]|uniref:Uncharacterized protein n=1 Tax=Alosa alosa TaxID=278164 RepID=A0AAV6G222_9TELE|nr:hypothetical protein AALO_G00208380 [Alosa alosa]